MKTNANRWKRAGALWAVLVILAGTGAACSRTGEPVTASGTEVTERTQPPTQPSAAAAPAEPDWRLLLVNARNPLPEGFTVELKTLEDGQAVDRRIWPDLCRMLEAAREAGLSPLICSAYRTNAQQQSLFLRKIRRLEAQGLPHQEARYVSGYLVRLRPGQTVTVTGENAHAWAEYYEPALNTWLVLEATPAVEETPAGVPGAVPETAPVPTTEAQPQASSESPAQTGTEPAPRPSQSPSGGPSTEPVPEPSGNRFGIVGIWLLLIAAAAAGLQGQRHLRLRLRRRRQHRCTPNAQALARWQETLLVARLLGETPPGELEALAQKAKFSQHTLGPEELAAFDSYLRGGKKRLRQMSWYRRLLYQYLYAVC